MSSNQKIFEKLVHLFQKKQFKRLEEEGVAILNDQSVDNEGKAAAYFVLSLCEDHKRRHEESFDLVKKAYDLNPEDVNINNAIGFHYLAVGENEKAEKHFRRAVQKNSSYDIAWYNLSRVKNFTDPDDEDIVAIEKLLKRRKVENNEEALCTLYFSLGKIYEDLKRYQQAIEHYFQANYFKGLRMNPSEVELGCRRIFEVFNKRCINQFQLEVVYPEITPIFIVGMARSGTSLVEQILLSHSKVSTVGEGQSMEAIINGFPRRFDRFNDLLASIECLKNETLTTAASRYLLGLKEKVSEDRLFIINKTPANYKYIGLIKMMFPNAKIIHMQRHPADNCVSCFFTNFSTGNNYAFDASYLGYFYRKYHELMTHWHEVLDDDFIFDLPYEAIVNHPEKNIRELLAFCGLDWEPACLEHEKLERYIATSSVMQANQPIYKTSIGRWEHYRPWLESLLNIDDLIENYKH